jgi:CDP-glucose 4,6-dehydratase
MYGGVYKGRRVLVTGQTGFKGAWLSHWLLSLGAEVRGYALAPQSDQPLHDWLDLGSRMQSQYADVRDRDALGSAVKMFQPEIIFHLAAQPLVRLSYSIPVETMATNVMGTAHLLEAVKQHVPSAAVVVVTSDKCYENREKLEGYREDDRMGGHDPYSASKGMTELLVSSWRHSYLPSSGPGALASARAGNVIGGGDFSADRIIPDCVRALEAGVPAIIRNRRATRPWQHVLEPLAGYLWLGACLHRPSLAAQPSRIREGFNFGPKGESARPVGDLVDTFLGEWPGKTEDRTDNNALHEASLLHLNINKSAEVLGWRPIWDFKTSVQITAAWYRHRHEGIKPRTLCDQDLMQYNAIAAADKLAWAQ